MGEFYSYFDFLNDLDKAIPFATEKDYMKVSFNELWDSIYSFIMNNPNLNQLFTKKEIKGLNKFVKDEYAGIYKPKYASGDQEVIDKYSKRNYDYSNVNIAIHIVNIRNAIIDMVIKKKDWLTYFGNYERMSAVHVERTYGKHIGSMEQISEHLSDKKIKEYVKRLLSFTWYNGQEFEYYPGIEKLEDGAPQKCWDKNAIVEYIADVFVESIMRYCGLISIFTEKDVPKYLSSMESQLKQDMIYIISSHEYNREPDERIIKIVLPAIKEMVEATKAKQRTLNEPHIVTNPTKKIHVGKPAKAKATEELPQNATTHNEVPGMEDVVLKYEKIQQMIEKNKQLTARLAQLAEERAKIEAEIIKNEEEIAKGLKLQ